jgi:flagellar basal-body rod protein FlgB
MTINSFYFRRSKLILKKLDAELNFHQAALRVRNQRQELLASNIANADTPQYKARDIDFQSAMQSALQQSAGVSPATEPTSDMQQTNNAHMNGNAGNGYPGSGDVLFRSLRQGSVDGNTVDMDVERNAYVDNGIRYKESLTMMTDKIKEVMAAINGQDK